MYFDGTGDYLNWSNSVFTFGTSDFTVEAWVYITGSSDFGIFGVGGASAGSYGLYWMNSTSKFQSTRYGDTAGAGTTTNAYSKNQWIHVAAVRVSGSGRIYVNGVIDSGATYNMGSITNSGAYAGAAWNSATGTGYITYLRVRTANALYTTNFAPSVAPLTPIAGTTLLLNGTNGGIIDYTGKNNLETVGDAKSSTTIVKYGSRSMRFSPGNSSYYLKVPLTSNLQFAAGEQFTIECWIYLNANAAGICAVWSNYNSFSSGTLSLFAGHGSSNSNLFIIAHNGTFPAASSSTTVNSRIGLWTHIAVVRNSDNYIRMYINGSVEGSAILSNVALTGVGPTFWIATTGDSTAGNPDMYVDDFRITKGYARYTANFTPPSSAFITK